MWEEAKKRFSVGSRIRGVVTQHRSFGVFVDLGDPVALGLVPITDFLDEERMTPEQYPPIGSQIEAVVLGHTDDRLKQIWLGMKPSQLGKLFPDKPRTADPYPLSGTPFHYEQPTEPVAEEDWEARQ